MPQLKIAVPTRALRLPWPRALPVIRQCGAAGVEFDARNEIRPAEFSRTAVRQIRKQLEDYELSVAAVAFRTSRGYHVEEGLERRVAATKEAMTFARSLGAGIVVNQVGRVPDDKEGRAWRMLVDVLRDLGTHGQKVGTLLAAETGSEEGAALASLIAALPPGSLGVTFNPGRLIINGFSPGEAVKALGGAICYVHAQDGVRDLARGRGIEVQLGRGEADFPALLGALEDQAYRGWFGIERELTSDPLAEFGQAVEYLRSF